MRKLISIVLSVLVLLSTSCISFAASNYDLYRTEVDNLNSMNVPVQPQRYHVVKSGGKYVSADSAGSGGICNVVAGTQLLNRRIAYDKNGNFSPSDLFTLEEVMIANGVEISEREVPYKHGNTGYVYTGATGSWYNKTYTKNGTTYNIAMKNSSDVRSDMQSKGISNFEDYIAQILIDHPEGICWRTAGHYVVITDYEYNSTTGKYTFYIIDGTNEIISGYKRGRLPLSETSLCRDNGVKTVKDNIGLIAYINAPKKPAHVCRSYETYKSGSTKVLGACKDCHTPYNWQDTFQKTTTQVYELKNNNKNDKVKVRNAPYEDATEHSNRVNKTFTVVGTVTNAYGNKWYVVDYQDDVKKMCYYAYVYSDNIDNKYIMTSSTAEAKKYDSANTSTKTHTHNYNYSNGMCYCGAVKATLLSNAESTLKISLTSYPVQHTQGKNFGLRGTISSNYQIKKIYGYIRQNGSVIQSSEDTPNSKSVNVKNQNLNNDLVFDRLNPGNYSLEVYAVDASGNGITVTKNFTVVGEVVKAESTLSINLDKYPVTLNEGSGFGLRGSVTSNYNITLVKGYVLNSNGSTVLSSKDAPNSANMDIRYANLNDDLVFNNLGAGNYTMKVVATDNSGRTVEVLKDFKVVSTKSNSSNSTLSINLEKYPVTLNVGSSYGLRGSITSNYNISVVRGYVTNSSGQTVLSSKDTPNSTYMDIKPSNLNWDLVFNNLSAGNYTMKVVAVDTSGRTIEATKNFTVKAKETYVDNTPNGNGVTGIVDIPSSWDNLSIRSGPSTNYSIVGSMNDGVSCTVYPNKTSNGWFYVNYNGVWGYASGNQIKINNNTASSTNTRVGIVNIPSDWTDLSIRTGPSTNYQIVGGMPHGARCTVYPDKKSNGWHYVEYNGVKGYAAGNRINLQ